MYCPNCGKQLPEGAKFCTACGTALSAPASAPSPADPPAQREPSAQQPEPAPVRPAAKGKKENIFLGIIGALIGVVLAFYMMVVVCEIIGLWGVFAGLFAAASIFFGYQALGRKLGIFGIIICLILLLFTVLFCNSVTWANAVSAVVPGYYAAKLGPSLAGLNEQIRTLPGLAESFLITLALRMGSALLGAVLIIVYAVRARSKPASAQPRGGRLFLGVIAVAILMTGVCFAMGGEPEQVEQKRGHPVVEMRKCLEAEGDRLVDTYGMP